MGIGGIDGHLLSLMGIECSCLFPPPSALRPPLYLSYSLALVGLFFVLGCDFCDEDFGTAVLCAAFSGFV